MAATVQEYLFSGLKKPITIIISWVSIINLNRLGHLDPTTRGLPTEMATCFHT